MATPKNILSDFPNLFSSKIINDVSIDSIVSSSLAPTKIRLWAKAALKFISSDSSSLKINSLIYSFNS